MTQFPFRSCHYNLMPAPAVSASAFPVPGLDTWQPKADLPLEQALPVSWDPVYTETYNQPFQPVNFWCSANIIAHFIQRNEGSSEADAAKTILRRLVERLREYVVDGDGRCWVENRFDFEQTGVSIPGPWNSGLSNAFAILGLRRCLDGLGNSDSEECNGLRGLVRSLANAYRAPFVEGQGGPERWISFVCKNGNLWFEEYPMPGGRPNLVLNGHIFAMLALNEAREIWPKEGYAMLINAGALSVAERFQEFQRRGKVNIYSLRGPRKSDYKPVRTVRQQFELFLLTGDDRFLSNAIRASVDISQSVDPERLRVVVDEGTKVINKRLRFDERVRRRRMEEGGVSSPLRPEVVPAFQPKPSLAQKLVALPVLRRIGRQLKQHRQGS
ncbi:MAG: D-glucuronyl C5-epimerase family protein [Rhodobacteraceae bacterium]|nr:D-glucuronyl C5-epimerase family protein [Paracoccaceae bacterium]